MEHYDVLIVGGGHAGAQTAIALRELGFAGSIGILGKETDLPYDRPPLSKEYLSGQVELASMLLRPAEFWSEQRIDLHLGHEVIEVDAAAGSVACANGSCFGYGALVWAAGGEARALACEGADAQGVHAIRTRAGVDRLKAELAAASRVVIVGGGYIGLETAAVLADMGKRVVVVEEQERVLARVAGEAVSRFFEAEHRERGVDLRLASKVARIHQNAGRAAGVEIAGGDVIECDLVIVGVGIVPAVAPLMCAGAAAGTTGVAVDGACRTSLPNVYALGDCAEHPNPFWEAGNIRLESLQNANEQAKIVARSITGEQASYDAVPWFWSNQYDLRLQTVGLSAGHDTCVLRGDPGNRSFSLVYLKNGRVVALDCINATKDFIQGKALVANRIALDVERLADASTQLRELARAATQAGAAPRPDRSGALRQQELKTH